MTLHTADKSRVLLANLDLEIQRGCRCLVTAADDAPKVALFRATAGVWECGTGKITRPGLEDLLFLPERPYLPPGTLRDVLLRTGMEAVIKDEEIIAELRQLGLEEALGRVGGLGADKDWDDAFSIGEQHLFSVARIFLARPAFVFLDRPGSSLPTAQIAAILDRLTAQNIGVVVLAKNGEMRLHYHVCLAINADGSWSIQRDAPAVMPYDLNC